MERCESMSYRFLLLGAGGAAEYRGHTSPVCALRCTTGYILFTFGRLLQKSGVPGVEI